MVQGEGYMHRFTRPRVEIQGASHPFYLASYFISAFFIAISPGFLHYIFNGFIYFKKYFTVEQTECEWCVELETITYFYIHLIKVFTFSVQ